MTFCKKFGKITGVSEMMDELEIKIKERKSSNEVYY